MTVLQTTHSLSPPHGGALVDLVVSRDRAAELAAEAEEWPSWWLTERQLCDLELLACGAFSPLRGFLGEADHVAVCEQMRLADGTLWPIPITLDVDTRTVDAAARHGWLALRAPDGTPLAALELKQAWAGHHPWEATKVFGTTDPAHPGVDHLLHRTHLWYVSGRLEVFQPPRHNDFTELRLTPAALRKRLERQGITRVVAFNTRNPMHRAHQELTLRAARRADAHLLLHPIVGPTMNGDVDRWTRTRCYQALLPSYPVGAATLALLPLAMRMGGPREALWHLLIRKNFGATHLIVGRDHAGPGPDNIGRPFYGPYDAQQLVARHQAEAGVTMVAFPQLGYVPASDSYEPVDGVPAGTTVLTISGTDVRKRLADGADLPSWFTPPAVAAELRRTFPRRSAQGVTVRLTGPSPLETARVGRVLEAILLERGDRKITVTEGLSAPDVAREVTRHGGIALCVGDLVSRTVLEKYGGFLHLHLGRADDDAADGADLVHEPTDDAAAEVVGRLVKLGYLQSP